MKLVGAPILAAIIGAIAFYLSAAPIAHAACGPGADPAGLGGVSSDLARIIGEAQRLRSGYCGPGPGTVDPGSDPGGAAPANQPNPGPRRPNEVIARINGDAQTAAAVARANNLVLVETRAIALLDAQSARYQIPDGRTIEAVVAQLNGDVRVAASDANHLFRLQQANNLEDARFAPRLINMDVTNTVGVSGAGTRIGVIDTAVDDQNAPLAGRIAKTFDGLPKVPVASRRHGTVVASLIAGGENFRGIAGNAAIYAARAFDLNADGEAITDYYVIEACIRWAARMNVRILNMSFAGPRNRLMEDILNKVAQRGMFLVASVGNEGPQAPPAFPAAFNSVVGVTALDEQRRIYAKANRGRHVFVAAPGVDVLAATPGGGIDIVGGTSFATPFVSGIAALIIERGRDLSPRSIATRMRTGAVDLGDPGRDPVYGHGLVDLARLFRP